MRMTTETIWERFARLRAPGSADSCMLECMHYSEANDERSTIRQNTTYRVEIISRKDEGRPTEGRRMQILYLEQDIAQSTLSEHNIPESCDLDGRRRFEHSLCE